LLIRNGASAECRDHRQHEWRRKKRGKSKKSGLEFNAHRSSLHHGGRQSFGIADSRAFDDCINTVSGNVLKRFDRCRSASEFDRIPFS